MRTTRYDLITSMMLALCGGLVIAVIALVVVWLTNRIPEPESPPVLELLELPGGREDGAIDETLRVDSEEELSEDPAVAENPTEETQIMETLDNVMELSDQASQLATQQFQSDPTEGGTPGRAEGTGRAPLGAGGPGAGLPRDQRWYVRFDDRGTVDAYARQLDFFGIELGALTANKLIYISELTSDSPKRRERNTGKDEKRLYMNWQGNGERRKADVELFKKAGVDASNALIFHFYPPQTEQLLAKLEFEYAKRPAQQIRRTYFVVRRDGNGYRFAVTRQLYFR
jgi:hypothetical protein